MSRGHTQGYDSNAAQFARMGNPWEGEPMTRKARRRGRKLRRDFDGQVRRPERASREGDDRVAELNFWSGFDARRAVRTRTIVPDEKSPTLAKIQPWTREIKAPSRSELERGRWQRFEFNAREMVATAIYEQSERHREEQRKLIQRRIEALESQLERL